ncbi:putative Adaptor complexes medium subunit family [Trypanosoma vivax]|uniref:Putative adaptor complex AP-3 medium subunit n=1 Tax=Trypanosoma vivax (strain Y486) TaxID=1055687 RepID=G0TU82_TRYVY|nr:putative adaptor complex AP-3 medium subunit [Trypanosoma vivax]KAH8614080.1 putative Adaptor complexes medium subunit family [Trypanosoma vivax]CCC47516.1 putative adaptor complex AP-3 medium subunit [Trypanosoma vivax Y486]
MISSVFFLNKHGEVIIEKQFREKIPRTSLEDFWVTYMAPLRSIEEAPSVVAYSRFSFLQIHRNDVVLLATSTVDGSVLLVMEMLSSVCKVIQSYVKVFSENTLRENFSVVCQLLEEMVDNGYPLTTEMHVLEELVAPPTLENKLRSAIDAPMRIKHRYLGLRSVPWRNPLTKHSSNEIFFDVMEHLDCIVDCKGNVVHSTIRGAVEVNCRLNGMPDVVMRLCNMDLIDDIAFHRCVRRSRYDIDRTISFIPVDGKFTLLQYRCKSPINAQLPFYVTPQITFNSANGRFNCMVGLRPSSMSANNREIGVSNLVVHLPLPPQTEAVQFHSNIHGATSFNKARSLLTWSIGALPRSVCSLSGEFTLVTENKGRSAVPFTGSSATIDFSMPNYLMSSIRIDSVQVLNEAEKPYKGVKYMTNSGRFVVRTV